MTFSTAVGFRTSELPPTSLYLFNSSRRSGVMPADSCVHWSAKKFSEPSLEGGIMFGDATKLSS